MDLQTNAQNFVTGGIAITTTFILYIYYLYWLLNVIVSNFYKSNI